jgi:hypothetical protein
MCNSLKRVGLLALTLAALALPSVGIAGVQAASKAEMGWQGRSAAKLIALHFKHEDALYQPRSWLPAVPRRRRLSRATASTGTTH